MFKEFFITEMEEYSIKNNKICFWDKCYRIYIIDENTAEVSYMTKGSKSKGKTYYDKAPKKKKFKRKIKNNKIKLNGTEVDISEIINKGIY